MKVLDCTLRDGGYANDWRFGCQGIHAIKEGLEKSGINIIELGFMRNETYDCNRSVFSSMEDVNALLMHKKPKVMYSVMIEAFNPFSLDNLCDASHSKVDLIRVCIWKRLLKEHLEYCKAIISKGYRITIQPSRVEQYSKDEFAAMMKMINELKPYAVYVVDTWGTQSKEQIVDYLTIANELLDPSIALGYHGHNNKMQALSCAQAALEMNLNREVCLDSTLFGMGRGAGNLNTEIITQYINEYYHGCYDTGHYAELIEKEIVKYNSNNVWGYSLYYFLAAFYSCNPNFATFFQTKKISIGIFKLFLESISNQEKIVFSKEFVYKKLEEMGYK